MPLRVLVADDHPMCRAAARLALTAIVPDAIVMEAETLAAATSVAEPIDLIVLDLNLPDSRGMSTLVEIRHQRPAATVLVISGSDNAPWVSSLASLGARGYVHKSADIPQIIDALRTILAGGTVFDRPNDDDASTSQDRLASLSPSEIRVLCAMSDGALNKQIAYHLGLSEVTVKHHVRAILHKLGVANRTKAVLLYRDASAAGAPR